VLRGTFAPAGNDALDPRPCVPRSFGHDTRFYGSDAAYRLLQLSYDARATSNEQPVLTARKPSARSSGVVYTF